jgi:hypothetical protein
MASQSQCNFLSDPNAARLALKVDRPRCKAGSVMTGRVYLYLPAVAAAAAADGAAGTADHSLTSSLPKKAQLRLILEGSEHTVSTSASSTAASAHDSHDRCHHRDHHANKNKSMERSKTLILTDCIPAVSLPAPLKATKIDTDTGGHVNTSTDKNKMEQAAPASCFEYPFQWQLPLHLPSSLFCFESADSETFAEIRYTLSATIVDAENSISGGAATDANGVLLQQQYPTTETVLYMAAKGPTEDHDTTTKNGDLTDPTAVTTSNPACLVHPQVFSIRDYSCFPLFVWCGWWRNQGVIRLGWETDQSIYSPGDIVTVHVTMDHPVSVEPRAVYVTCLETVTWQGASPGQSTSRQHSVSRCLAQHVVLRADWKHRDHCNTGTGTSASPLVQLWEVTARIRLPAEARDSYTGSLVTVRHCLAVLVDTMDNKIRKSSNRNSGRSSCCDSVTPQAVGPIQIVRRGCTESATATARVAPEAVTAPATTTTVDEGVTTETERDKISVARDKNLDELIGWRPVLREKEVQQEVIASSTVRYPEQEQDLDYDPQATTSTPPSSMMDCSDNLAFLLAAGECDSGWQCQEQCRKLQLKQLVQRHPEQLSCLVQDAAWAVTVQNLTPCDYSALVVSAGSQAVVTARLLAVIMGPRRFTVRHVLATVRCLHDGNLCMEVLRQTVNLAGDLPLSRVWLEQQMDETEMIHLQSALTRC